MDNKEYVKQAISTLSNGFHKDKVSNDLLHAAIGIATESGEFLDALKKSLFYGKDLDKVNLREEMGDIMWYIAIACHALDTDLSTVMDVNIAKLRARFPNKFTNEAALTRNLDKEREILEQA